MHQSYLTFKFVAGREGTEFFQNPDPASAATTKQCDASGEDPTCSDSIPSQGIDAAHLTVRRLIFPSHY
jgi:hypothetical protein